MYKYIYIYIYAYVCTSKSSACISACSRSALSRASSWNLNSKLRMSAVCVAVPATLVSGLGCLQRRRGARKMQKHA